MVAGISRSQCAITKEVFEYKVGSQRFQTWRLEIQLEGGVEVEVSTSLTASHLQTLKVYFNVTAWYEDLTAQEIRGRISPHIKATSIVPKKEKSQKGPLFHCIWGGDSSGIKNKYSSSWVSAGMEGESFQSKGLEAVVNVCKHHLFPPRNLTSDLYQLITFVFFVYLIG